MPKEDSKDPLTSMWIADNNRNKRADTDYKNMIQM
jgi:hypothetical protein